jgi:hypothetical protein
MHVVETKVYQFSELDESAKDRAREWYREGVCTDSDWYEFVYEAATTAATLLGIEIGTKSHKTMGGSTGYSPRIWFSGFASQGDGASWEGEYQYKRGSCAAVRAEFPQDTELHGIADRLYRVQRRNFYSLSAHVSQSGRYQHSGSMAITVSRHDDDFYTSYERDTDSDGYEVVQVLREFADWIYSSLESEYEYQNSNESVDESIEANEYTFTESGKRFG